MLSVSGPVPLTVNDFWRMIWEHDVSKIVMLSNLVEDGKVYVDNYSHQCRTFSPLTIYESERNIKSWRNML